MESIETKPLGGRGVVRCVFSPDRARLDLAWRHRRNSPLFQLSSGWNFISAIISNLLKYLRVLNSIGEERFSYSQRVEPIFLAVHTPLIFFFFVFCSYYSTVVPHVKSDNYANRSFYRKICERRIPDFVDTSFDTLFNTHLRLTPTNPNLA